jgi:chaperonin GroEL
LTPKKLPKKPMQFIDRKLDSGMGEAVARRTYLRRVTDKDSSRERWETWSEVADRVELLQNLITQEPFDGVKDIYRKSIARLLGGVVFLKIGGYSDTERKEIMDRAEDAVLAVESAKKGGVVVGGGVTLADIAFGKEGIVYEAIKVPKELIARNMGVNDLNGKSLLAAGIIDPVLVLQGAVRNSASVATIMLQCSLLITDKEEAKHGFNS